MLDEIVLYIDIDGTITQEPFMHFLDYNKSTPNVQVINKINLLYEKGYKVILYTSRFTIDNKVTREWLLKYNVKFHDIIFDKPRGSYFIDDKNLTITEFLEKEF